jgi:hypothetical protein
MAQLVRYNGKWFQIRSKMYEPERQTTEIAWSMIRTPEMKSQEAYREWYKKERENAKILYPSFRKENDSV